MADELFDLRNHFYLKNYQAGINEGSSVRPSTPAVTLERDVLVYRCFVGLGNNKMVRPARCFVPEHMYSMWLTDITCLGAGRGDRHGSCRAAGSQAPGRVQRGQAARPISRWRARRAR